jgi:Subtilase family
MLAALMAAPALAVGSAGAAQADAVRQQELWVLNAINVAGAWQHTHGAGVTVALIDSGVNGDVSDLTGSVITGRDFSGVDTLPTDPNWGVHGTWMASLIAGHGGAPDGTSGIIGVAPAAKILSIRAVTDQGDPEYRRYQHESESRVQRHLADAIQYAAKKGVSVISMSLGYQGASLPVRAAITAALAKGIVVVASSGNSGGISSGQHGNAPYSFPADYPGVLGVGAVDQDGQPAGFSSDNLSVQVAAPGVRVPAQGRDDQYWLVSGTSPACALTAGVAALIKSVYPALAPALVVQAITASARNRPQGGYDEEVGSGTVDATAALRMAGRLAHDQGTGHGLIAAAQLFGGGTAAIPPVPVAPRGKRQFVVDSLVALVCLAFVLIVTFRLIVTRRPAGALAGVPGTAGGGGSAGGGGWAAGGAAGGWAGTGPPNADLPDPGPPGPGAPGPGAPGPDGADPGGAGPGGAWSAGEAWPDGDGPGYGRTAGYWAPGGYKPSAGYPAASGYGQSADFQQPADPGPSAEYRAPEGYQRPPDSAEYGAPEGYQPLTGSAGYDAPDGYRPPDAGPPAGSGLSGSAWPVGSGEPAGYDAPDGYQPSAEPVPPAGYAGPASSGEPAGPKEPSGYRRWPGSRPQTQPGSPPPAGPPTGNGLPSGNGLSSDTGLSAGYVPSSGDGRSGDSAPPGIPGAPAGSGFRGPFETAAGGSPDANTGPLARHREPAEPQDPDSPAADPPAADDPTWPSAGQW